VRLGHQLLKCSEVAGTGRPECTWKNTLTGLGAKEFDKPLKPGTIGHGDIVPSVGGASQA
jgi:hypothetical protein